MQQPLEPNSNNIKEQFAQGQPALTPDQLEQMRLEHEQHLKKVIPSMELQKQYNDLKIAMLESDVLLGNISPNQIPGLLGIELIVRKISAEGYIGQWAAGQKNAHNRQKEEQVMRNISEIGIAGSVYYESNTPENVGRIAAFSKGQEYNDKWKTIVDNPEGKFSIDVPIKGKEKEFRTIHIKPGMYMIRDTQGELWAIEPGHYKQVMEIKAREEFEKLPKEEQERLQQQAIDEYNKIVEAQKSGGAA